MSKINQLLQGVNVVNVGIEMFKDDVVRQGASAIQLDWRPPGGGKPEVIAALGALSQAAVAERIAIANKQAVERIIQSHPVLVGFRAGNRCRAGHDQDDDPARRPADRLGTDVRRHARCGDGRAGVRATRQERRRGGRARRLRGDHLLAVSRA